MELLTNMMEALHVKKKNSLSLAKNVPALKIESGEQYDGFVSIVFYLARQSSDSASLLGSTPLERALVLEWVEYAAHFNFSDAMNRLLELNAHLSRRCFLATNSNISAADHAVFLVIRPFVAKLSYQDKENLIHLCRWFSLMQTYYRTRVEPVIFSKTLLYI